MKIKIFILFFLFGGCMSAAKAQSFYEIKWEADKVNYTALIIFYDLERNHRKGKI